MKERSCRRHPRRLYEGLFPVLAPATVVRIVRRLYPIDGSSDRTGLRKSPPTTRPIRCAPTKRPCRAIPGQQRNGLTDGTLSCRGGDDIPRDFVVGDVLCDPRHELRRAALHHLPDARAKLMEEIDPASLPIVEPKLLNVAEADRAQYGR